jgi:hypothetical protein
MHKVLVAARFGRADAARTIGWCAIAISICSCSANSQSNAQNISSTATPVVEAKIVAQPLPLAPTTKSSPAVGSPSPQIGTTPSASVESAPYVNPLDSIALNAKDRLANAPTSTRQARLKSATLTNASARINTDDGGGNIEIEQLSKALASSNQNSPGGKDRQARLPAQNSLSPSASCRAFPCLVLSRDPNHPQNRFNNPIYKLTAYRDRTSDSSFQLDAVTGRGFTQTRNRYQSNTEAPLPDGSYAVAATVVKGTIREVGGTMVPIFPKPGFDPRMRRTALGIHWDPSFDKDDKEDGTSGCIALTSKNDYHKVRDFVLKYRPRSLEVRITR